MSNHLAERPSPTDRVAKWIRRLCVPIVLFWLAVAALTNVLVPQLEVVGEEHNVALSSPDSPSLQAFKRIGKVFHEFDSDSAAMVVLEGDQPLGADAHRYYDELVKRFNAGHQARPARAGLLGRPADRRRLTEPRRQGRLRPGVSGRQPRRGVVDGVRRRGARHRRQDAGAAGRQGLRRRRGAQIADQFEVGNEGTAKVTVLTVGVIAMMLLLVYRSLVTMILALVTVLIELSAARGIVAFLANAGIIGLSTYSTNILTLLVIAAGTDYAIFLLGRYHEGRNDGKDREAAFYDMYRGTSHVILGSGLTIAGAVFCLYFTRLPYFQSLGIPAAIGVLVSLVASLTLAPAVLVIGSRFGLLEPKRKTAKRGWRRIGTAIVRWPGPILIATSGARLRRTGRAVRLQDQLRHQQVHAGQRRRPMWATPPRSGTSRRRG